MQDDLGHTSGAAVGKVAVKHKELVLHAIAELRVRSCHKQDIHVFEHILTMRAEQWQCVR